MPSIKLSSGTINYLDQGHGTPLVLLHANPGDSKDFEAIIPELAKHNRVLALDWPGYGKSDIAQASESVNVMFFYNTLLEFISALELPSAFFIGNSIGGNAAARLAIEFPEKVCGLVLVSPGGFTPHNFISRGFCSFQGSRFSLSPFRFASLYLKHRTPTVTAMLNRAATLQATPERIALNRSMWRSFSQPENDLRELSRKINCKTLLIFGKSDPAVSASKDGKVAAQCIPSAQFAVLPCGHAAFAEIPEQFLDIVQPFII
jgi:pimeloyl-ACP methyl ester carboxylesterase